MKKNDSIIPIKSLAQQDRPTKRAARYYLTIFLVGRLRQVHEMGQVMSSR
jgi:hypothetical protein